MAELPLHTRAALLQGDWSMPSVSRKQHNLMEMVAHGGKPRGKKGPSVAVAKEFVAADKGRKAYGRAKKGGRR